jgi:hypothetical protein
MGAKLNSYRSFVRKPEGKRSLGRSRRILENNIKMDLRETVWAGFGWLRIDTCGGLLLPL